ncbi:DUF6656 family protein [Rhizobium sp. L1K21]|uniref:DUF6656 family protein n=1 Tax=Rhizobium sp. L1K21 TaxID=2954933 RepID=UPI002092F694|nr:DUF6656 family protein [Rhizobium sp. L1K21]MCO6186892.1 hypothetical protein [Rhizobium sp. L1K21]
MTKFRYYAKKSTSKALVPTRAVHSNFLRTGRIERWKEDWLEEEKRYLTYEEVAERTGKRLESAGVKTHERLNNFHYDIRFPKLIFHKTLPAAPHLGYVHVTASKTSFAEHENVNWGFYIANFAAEITGDERFFSHVDPRYSRMYFAVAMKMEGEGETRRLTINREIRDNGLLFRTGNPMSAFKNVLLLGAKTADLRRIIQAIA